MFTKYLETKISSKEFEKMQMAIKHYSLSEATTPKENPSQHLFELLLDYVQNNNSYTKILFNTLCLKLFSDIIPESERSQYLSCTPLEQQIQTI